MLDEKTIELIAIGCSISANCHPCIKYHVSHARELGIADEDIKQAIDTGKMVRKGAAQQMDKMLLENY